MKKILLAAAFSMAAFALQAQTVTQAQLQGKWRMAKVVNSQGTVDIIKGTWILSEAGKAEQGAEEMFNDMVLQAQDAVLEIKGDTASQVVMGQDYSSVFTLEDKDGKTYMAMDDGTTGMPQVYIKEGNMYIVDKDADVEIVYTHIK